MHVNGYEIAAIETSRFRLDGGAMFGVVPRVLWEKKITPDDRGRIPLAMRALLLVGLGRVVLVDAGIGDKEDTRFRDMFAVDDSATSLLRSLEERGLSPEDVTDVIITHAHFDHVGGCTRLENDIPAPTFPRARHHIQKDNLEAAMSPNLKERASYRPENILPLVEAGLLEVHEGPGEIVEGIEVALHDGHTRGQQCVKVSDSRHTVFYCADLIPTSHHVPSPWVMAYDCEPLSTVREKERLYARAADEGWVLVFEHDPDTPAGRVARTSKGYRLGETVDI